MKKWYQSKTLWFNVITLILLVIGEVYKTFPFDPKLYGIITGLGNIILRVFTNTGLFMNDTEFKGEGSN